MKNLKNTRALVVEILSANEKARGSDSYLYFCVLNAVAEKNGIALDDITVRDFWLNMTDSPFPPYETVRRSRQWAQQKFPFLSADERVKGWRAENELEYKAVFAGGGANG